MNNTYHLNAVPALPNQKWLRAVPFTIALALAPAIVANTAPPALSQPAPGIEVPGVRGLLDQFQAQQSSSPKRVIVVLNEASLSGQPATGSAVRSLPRNLGTIEPDQLQRANQRLAQKFSALRLPSLKPLQGLPIATVEVTTAQLVQLANSGEFAVIVEDRLSAPTLAESDAIMRVNSVHSRGFRGAGRTVAILDTGVETNHPFLNGRVVEGACFSSNVPLQGATSVCPGGVTSATTLASSIPCTIAGCDHGTHVAGIAAGRAAGAMAFNGVAPDANIMSVQVFSRFTDVPPGIPGPRTCANLGFASPCILSYSSDQIQGLNRVNLRRAALSISSANLSLGGGQFNAACDTDPLKPIIDTLLSNGVATVIASGNSGFTNAVGSPGCISTAVTVGSTTDSDQISSFTNMSNQVDLLATGSAIQSSITAGGFGGKSGTSMATPQVTGALAVLSSASPGTPIGTTISNLIASGVPITDTRAGASIRRPRLDLEAAVNTAKWRLIGTGDLNGDGTVDILWQHNNGQVHFWPIVNGQRQGGINISSPVGPEWRLIGARDLNGDKTDDILWQHNNGQVHYWPILNGQRQAGINISSPVGPEWRLIGSWDLNGDGTYDILWQHNNGQVHYWPIVNGQRQAGINISSPVGPDWRLIGGGDLNGDKTDDILWQYINGQVHYWPILNGQRQAGINISSPVGPEWRLISVRDLNGDKTDDILWRHNNGQVHYWPILNGQRQAGINISSAVGPVWKLIGARDLNGDKTDDILWQHINGQVHYWPILNGQRQAGINIFVPVGPEWRLIGGD